MRPAFRGLAGARGREAGDAHGKVGSTVNEHGDPHGDLLASVILERNKEESALRARNRREEDRVFSPLREGRCFQGGRRLRRCA